MIAVIFEVEPNKEGMATYLDLAVQLREELDKIDGFLSVERFESLTQPGKLLSLSFFENEEAVINWRNHSQHQQAQSAGRSGLFDGYRLRVADVIRDYGLSERSEAPQ